jgi:glucose-6-phosphate 1-dehydrogenase
MTRPRAPSGTIPSMETTHDELKDNTIIVGQLLIYLLVSVSSLTYGYSVLGASGDLAKKKVHWCLRN